MCQNIFPILCIYTIIFLPWKFFCKFVCALNVKQAQIWSVSHFANKIFSKKWDIKPQNKACVSVNACLNVLSKFSLLYFDIRGGTGSPLFYLQAVFWLTRAVLTRLETCSPRFVRPRPTSVMSGSTLHTSTWSRSSMSPQYKW